MFRQEKREYIRKDKDEDRESKKERRPSKTKKNIIELPVFSLKEKLFDKREGTKKCNDTKKERNNQAETEKEMRKKLIEEK